MGHPQTGHLPAWRLMKMSLLMIPLPDAFPLPPREPSFPPGSAVNLAHQHNESHYRDEHQDHSRDSFPFRLGHTTSILFSGRLGLSSGYLSLYPNRIQCSSEDRNQQTPLSSFQTVP